jgi:hypothetical protein
MPGARRCSIARTRRGMPRAAPGAPGGGPGALRAGSTGPRGKLREAAQKQRSRLERGDEVVDALMIAREAEIEEEDRLGLLRPVGAASGGAGGDDATRPGLGLGGAIQPGRRAGEGFPLRVQPRTCSRSVRGARSREASEVARAACEHARVGASSREGEGGRARASELDGRRRRSREGERARARRREHARGGAAGAAGVPTRPRPRSHGRRGAAAIEGEVARARASQHGRGHVFGGFTPSSLIRG